MEERERDVEAVGNGKGKDKRVRGGRESEKTGHVGSQGGGQRRGRKARR